MIAAIYARKSTEQRVSEDAKSVTRQIEHARQYAEKKGWTVDDRYIFSDDGVSGAEFKTRPGLQHLLGTLVPQRFDVLIIEDESRLGRDRIQTDSCMAVIADAGIRLFCYLADREIRMDDDTLAMMESFRGYATQQQRRQASVKVYDAFVKRAKAGQVCGGVVYGYVNEPVFIGDKKSHVRRAIEPVQAATVRRVFALCAAGKSLRAIALILNADGSPSPRARRPDTVRLRASWSQSAIRHMLYNDLYRGMMIWNKTRTIPRILGKGKVTRVPAAEWITVPAPELAIVTDQEWTAAHARLKMTRESYLRITGGGRLYGRPANGLDSHYLLVGNALCTTCGGSLGVRPFFAKGAGFHKYACATHRDRGPHACANAVELPMSEVDREVLAVILKQVLCPHTITAAIKKAALHARRGGGDRARQRQALVQEIKTLEAERARLAQAIATGGQLPALIAELTKREARLQQIQEALVGLDQQAAMTDLDLKRMEKDLATHPRFTEWQRMLAGHVPQARQLLRLILGGKRLRFTPIFERGHWGFAFTGQACLGTLLSGSGVIGTVGVPNGI